MNKLNPLEFVEEPGADAVLGRNLVRWRSPVFGYVDMYINPQTLEISEKKSLTSTRTKAGFILQYAGEELTEIRISGTTGSAGAEGINILHAVYRSEHIAFSGIAEQLEQEFSQQVAANTTSSILDSALSLIGRPGVSQLTAGAALNFANQPFPSLANLAASIEMKFQGVTYRGYFTSFSFSEQAQSPGLFDYSMSFSAYATLGSRKNFMPWHRQPVGPADSNRIDNFSFSSSVEFPQRPDSQPTPSVPPARPPNIGASRQLSVNKEDLINSIEFAPVRGNTTRT